MKNFDEIEAYASSEYARYLNDATTERLLEGYRLLPSVACRDELERRDVQLWAHGLTRIEG